MEAAFLGDIIHNYANNGARIGNWYMEGTSLPAAFDKRDARSTCVASIVAETRKAIGGQ
jgi:hypothetical protein